MTVCGGRDNSQICHDLDNVFVYSSGILEVNVFSKMRWIGCLSNVGAPDQHEQGMPDALLACSHHPPPNLFWVLYWEIVDTDAEDVRPSTHEIELLKPAER